MKTTVALQMIIKDEVDAVKRLLEDALPFFDQLNLTVSNEAAATELKVIANEYNRMPNHGDRYITVEHRPWNNNFADARNANLELNGADYFFWLDADDSFDFSTIPGLVRYAADGGYDMLYLPYNYAQDKLGNSLAWHYRERIINAHAGFEWRGAVHENLLRDGGEWKAQRLEQPVITHHGGDPESSKMRNHAILLAQVEGVDEPDPRDLYYLGISYFALGEYHDAIKTLNAYTHVGGWDEEIYRALLKMSESFFMLDNISSANDCALRAAGMLPAYPEAYFTLARYEYAQENWPQCLEWLEVAFSKPEPKTMSITNPQAKDMAKLQAATCYFSLGQFTKAYKYLSQVPDYLKDDIVDTFKYEANKETFANLLPQILDSGFVADEKAIYRGLTTDMQFDGRLKWLRNKVIEPKVWADKTIVFFCGAGYEEWGAHTLDKGMGGSEEAVVYLSRELAHRGYKVTIYNQVSEKHEETSGYLPSKIDGHLVADPMITYLPYQEFDTRDTFDTLVVWRAPQYAKRLKAKTKIVDLHDVLPENAVKALDDATYFVKSQWQRNLYPNLPDEQFHVIGNGIVASQFNGAAEIAKREGSVGYFSSYYRGLETLVDLWPQIRSQAIERGIEYPTLDVAYGWGSYTAFQGEDDFYNRMNAKIAAVQEQYPNELIMHDRLSHTDLAKLMLDVQVWAYPTQFPETHCITALKAQEARCWPVTTTVAALAETVRCGDRFDTEIIYTNEYDQRKFVKAVVDALVEHKTGTPVEGADWSFVADDWLKFIEGTK